MNGVGNKDKFPEGIARLNAIGLHSTYNFILFCCLGK